MSYNKADGKNPVPILACGRSETSPTCWDISQPCHGKKQKAAMLKVSKWESTNSAGVTTKHGTLSCPVGYTRYSSNHHGSKKFSIGGDSTTDKNKMTWWYNSKNPGEFLTYDKCGNSSNKHETQKLCILDKYTADHDKARCYMGDRYMDPKDNTSEIPLLFQGKQYVNNRSICPADYDVPRAKEKFMKSYCGKWDNITSDICNDFWYSSTAYEKDRDSRVIDLCTTDKYKNNIRCSCVNAQAPADSQIPLGWAYSKDCLDPKNETLKTSDMKNINIQICNQYWDAINNDHSIIKDNTMEQTCIQNDQPNPHTDDPVPDDPPSGGFDPDDGDDPGPSKHDPGDHPGDHHGDDPVPGDDSGDTPADDPVTPIKPKPKPKPEPDDSLPSWIENRDGKYYIFNIPLMYLVVLFILLIVTGMVLRKSHHKRHRQKN